MLEQILITEAQLCLVLGMSRSAVRRLRLSGRLSPVNIGRSIRYRPADVERFVSELQTEVDDTSHETAKAKPDQKNVSGKASAV